MTKEQAIMYLKTMQGICAPGDMMAKEAVKMAVEALQTEVVRCKECANCLHYDDETENEWPWCTINTRPTSEEDFCSFGERKGGDD